MKTLGKIALGLAVMLAPILSQAQTKSYNETGFTGVVFGVSGNLTVRQGNTYKVELSGEEEDLEKIEVEVKGDRLVISTKGNSWRRMRDISGTVTLPNIEVLAVSGSGTLKTAGSINTGDLNLAVSGSGDMVITGLSADDCKIAISGSGSIVAAGECEDLVVAISGSGDLDAKDLKANDCEAVVSGSGAAKVHVNGALKARISGSGDVYYVGRPSDIDSKVSGSGAVRKL